MKQFTTRIGSHELLGTTFRAQKSVPDSLSSRELILLVHGFTTRVESELELPLVLHGVVSKRKARGARGRGQECSKVVIQWVGKIQEYDHSDRSQFWGCMFNTNPIIGLLQWRWYPNCPNVWECGSDRHRLKPPEARKRE